MSIPRFRPSLSFAEAAALAGAILPLRRDRRNDLQQAMADRLLDGGEVVLAPSARIALYWLLRALGLEPGDEVVTQAFNFPAVPAAVRAAGLMPRFVDLAADSFEGDWARLEECIGPRTRAVIVTHLYGNPVELGPVIELCERRGLILIEDCAQGAGATWDRRPVGTFGSGAVFSLGPTKNLTLLGGGAVAVRDAAVAARIRELAAPHRQVGLVGTAKLAAKAAFLCAATHPLLFTPFVLPTLRALERRGLDLVHRVMEERSFELENVERAPLPSPEMAAVGRVQLERLAARNRARARNGWYLRTVLVDRGRAVGLTVPAMREGSVFMSFPVLHPRREALARELRRRGVDTDDGFMADCSSMELFAESAAECPNAARVAREILHLPVHPFLTKAQLDRVAREVGGALAAV